MLRSTPSTIMSRLRSASHSTASALEGRGYTVAKTPGLAEVRIMMVAGADVGWLQTVLADDAPRRHSATAGAPKDES